MRLSGFDEFSIERRRICGIDIDLETVLAGVAGTGDDRRRDRDGATREAVLLH